MCIISSSGQRKVAGGVGTGVDLASFSMPPAHPMLVILSPGSVDSLHLSLSFPHTRAISLSLQDLPKFGSPFLNPLFLPSLPHREPCI